MAPRADRGRRLTGDLVRYERALRAQGFTRVAGADEAGRGALAGPLVAAAVVLPDGFDPEGIDDSKVLTRHQREAAYERIVAAALYTVAKAEPAVIDRRGLHRSNLALLRRCIRALDPVPEYALTDGFPVLADAVSLARDQEGRRGGGLGRGRLDRREGDPGPDHGAHASPVPGVRLRSQRGLRHARSTSRCSTGSGPRRSTGSRSRAWVSRCSRGWTGRSASRPGKRPRMRA